MTPVLTVDDLDDGVLVVYGAPSLLHQLALGRLTAFWAASPSTGRYDQTRKKQVYAEFGIPDYWIVTPDAQKPDITAFRLDGKHDKRVAYASGEATFTAIRPFPVSFTPAELVSAGQSWLSSAALATEVTTAAGRAVGVMDLVRVAAAAAGAFRVNLALAV
jgi:hypothetical protein